MDATESDLIANLGLEDANACTVLFPELPADGLFVGADAADAGPGLRVRQFRRPGRPHGSDVGRGLARTDGAGSRGNARATPPQICKFFFVTRDRYVGLI